ncbi:MAG TPA: cobalamin-dependent protein [Blastocatellia bacterium]|nr:cobalamin-dependent protein [Blastocatellia bacterium]
MEELNLQVCIKIEAARSRLADRVTERQYAMRPELVGRYGEAGREKCRQDAAYHLSYLSQAIRSGRPQLFADYVAWAKVMLAGRGIPAEDLALNLECLRQAIEQDLGSQATSIADDYIKVALDQLPRSPSELPSFIEQTEPLADLARPYLGALLRGDRQAAGRMILKAVEDGASVKDIYLSVFQRSQYEIGRLWQMNRISVAQEHYCTAATQLIMSQLYPLIFSGEKNGRTLVATCVGGDLHEIGVRMVSDFFEMEGWDTFYLGANTPTESILQTVVERKADVLAVSATMTFNVNVVAEIIAAMRAAPATAGLKIIVGGYPFNVSPDLWREIGADACPGDALEAVALANRLVEGER